MGKDPGGKGSFMAMEPNSLAPIEFPSASNTFKSYPGKGRVGDPILIGSFSIPIINFFIFNDEIVFFFIIMFVLIFYTHRENIKRLLNRTESKSKIY